MKYRYSASLNNLWYMANGHGGEEHNKHMYICMNVVFGGPVHHQVLHVGELLGLGVDVTGLVTSQVVVRGGQSQVQTTSDTVFCPLKCDGKLVIMKIS